MATEDHVKSGDDIQLTYTLNADISGATSIRWLARPRPGTDPLMEVAGTIGTTSADSSTVDVQLTPTETAAAGYWYVEIEVTVAGRVATYPSSGYAKLVIEADLG